MRDFKDSYINIVKVCRKLGVGYSDMMRLTLVEIEAMGEAYRQSVTERVNNDLFVAYQQAALTGIATNNPAKFPTKAPTVTIREEQDKVVDPEAVYNTVWNIAQMFGATKPEGPAGV